MKNKLISISTIKKMYPDEWVLIGNPAEANGELHGILISHNRDKRALALNVATENSNAAFDKTILRYTENLSEIGKWLKFTPSI